MDLPSKKIFEFLLSKGVSRLYHANTVITACQFLRQQSLLSRGTVDRRGLYQTSQKSDDTDKELGLWFDVFADSVDIHERINKANHYGPVLFILNLESLIEAYTGRIWVTKCNPVYWLGKARHQRWFDSVSELKNEFVRGDLGYMIVFRHSGGELPIAKCLESVMLDDPKFGSKLDYFSMAYGALRLAMTESGEHVPLERRQCRTGCRCVDDYSQQKERTKKMFVPRV